MPEKSTHSPLPPPVTPTLTAAGQLLLDELFEGQRNALYAPMKQWIATSKPFLAFAQEYLSKIRKKVRIVRDAEESYNLYCELRTAYLLVQEPKFAVAYEAYGKEQGRSADFAVTFRTNMLFHVEVTRMSTSQQEQHFDQQGDAASNASHEEQLELIRRNESRRLTDVVCDKFQQLLPDTPNILWVWSESRVIHTLDVGQVMVGLKQRVEQRDADLFSRYGFSKPADFLRYYQRLSAIIVQSLHDTGPNRATLWWQNKDAKHPFPSKVTTLLAARIATENSPAFATNRIEK